MLKTIKTTKHMRLDELIKYVRENKENLFKGRVSTEFKTENNKEIIFIDNGNFITTNRINIDDLFIVEVEEEITEDTKFNILVKLFYEDGEYCVLTYYNSSVRDIKDDTTIFIYALLDKGLECIWDVRINGSRETEL